MVANVRGICAFNDQLAPCVRLRVSGNDWHVSVNRYRWWL